MSATCECAVQLVADSSRCKAGTPAHGVLTMRVLDLCRHRFDTFGAPSTDRTYIFNGAQFRGARLGRLSCQQVS
jgi:hypothetical protein